MIDADALPLFYQIAALLVLAASVGLVGVGLRQPLIVSYIAVGLIAGPAGLGIAVVGEPMELLADLGVALLLFLVGLKLDVSLVRSVGIVAVATGLGQVVFTAVVGFMICLGLGMPWLTSLYVSIALTFSSTIIIVKLLSDKGEIGSLHGRIALGFLIVQDIVVVLAMVTLSTLGVGTVDHRSAIGMLEMLIGGVAFIAGTAAFVRYAADPLVERLARSPELLVSFAIGWAAFLAALADYLGFGKELGGLLAGVSLASTPYREAMSTRLTSLRDFLLLFFFIALGASLDLGHLGDDVPSALVLSTFVLVGNPMIVLVIMGVMGYRKRTGFLAGLTVAQISEFSLIFMAMGVTLGHVDQRAIGLVTIVGLVTIAVSVYMIMFSHRLYGWLAPVLTVFEREHPVREGIGREEAASGVYDVIVFGLGRYGGSILQLLRAEGFRILGVDFSPSAVRRWREEGLDTVYGDVGDPELVASLPLERARWVVSAIPEHDVSLAEMDPRVALVEVLRAKGYAGRVAIASHREASVERLHQLRADLVLIPSRDAAERAVELLLGEQRQERFEIIDAEEQKELAG